MEQTGREKLQQIINDINGAFQTIDFAKSSLLTALSVKLNELLAYIEELERRVRALEEKKQE